MAGLILGQIPLGLYLLRMTPGLANLWLFGLHKVLASPSSVSSWSV